jgi:hypothetical protein
VCQVLLARQAHLRPGGANTLEESSEVSRVLDTLLQKAQQKPAKGGGELGGGGQTVLRDRRGVGKDGGVLERYGGGGEGGWGGRKGGGREGGDHDHHMAEKVMGRRGVGREESDDGQTLFQDLTHEFFMQ